MRLLLPYVARHWTALAGASFATLVLAAAELASPWPLKFVIDRLLEGEPSSFALGREDLVFLGLVAGAVVAIALVEASANYYSHLWLNQAAERIVHDLRVATYTHLQRLSLAYHQRRAKGELVTHVTGDVTAVGQLFSQTLGTLASSSVLLVGMAAITILLDPILAAAMFALVPVLILVSRRSQRTIRGLARRQRAADGEIASLATEALSAMPVVKAFGAETYESERVGVWSDTRRRTAVEASRAEAAYGGIVDVIGALSAAAVLVLGVFRVASGALAPGDLIVFVAYARRIYRPVRDIVKEITRAARATARAERIAEVLSADEMLEDTHCAPDGPRALGHVELDGVTFAYESGRLALRDVSLRVPVGSRLVVVGRSGAGKSTVCALIARFSDPNLGRVLIDGRDARSMPLSWLRAQVGLLLQDTLLFTGTVAENIAYGTDARAEDVVTAAKAAGAHDFISKLPAGYETELGPGGVGLSGGQRQRVGIARVLLRDPPILLLDEPTTGLDVESEAAVVEGISALMKGRTTIMFTHSLDLARSADRVLVLDEGSVVEEGPPDELLQRLGLFSAMASRRISPVATRRESVSPKDGASPNGGARPAADAVLSAVRSALAGR